MPVQLNWDLSKLHFADQCQPEGHVQGHCAVYVLHRWTLELGIGLVGNHCSKEMEAGSTDVPQGWVSQGHHEGVGRPGGESISLTLPDERLPELFGSWALL